MEKNYLGDKGTSKLMKIIHAVIKEEVQSVLSKTIPDHNHVYSSVVTKEATCTETGSVTHTCSLCGDTFTIETPALGHNFVDGVCSVCGGATYRS